MRVPSGYVIRGGSVDGAPGAPPAQYAALTARFLLRTLQIRYRQVALGCAWAVAQPLALAAIAVVVVHRWLGVPGAGPSYALEAYTGLMVWTFFSGGLMQAVPALVDQSDLVRKAWFPRSALPLGVLGAHAVDLCLALGLWLLGLAAFGGTWSPWLLAIPLALLPLALWTLACTLAGAAINVHWRDVKHALPLLLQVLFFATPVVYSLDHVPAPWRSVLGAHPVAATIEALRALAAGGPPAWPVFAFGTGVACVACLGIAWCFRRAAVRFADVI